MPVAKWHWKCCFFQYIKKSHCLAAGACLSVCLTIFPVPWIELTGRIWVKMSNISKHWLLFMNAQTFCVTKLKLSMFNNWVSMHILTWSSLPVDHCSIKGHLRSGCSGMAMRSHSRLTLYWLLTLEVRLPKGWRGMVPMTSGNSRHSLDVPGTSTQTCGDKKTF